jgi:hypothetical protein
VSLIEVRQTHRFSTWLAGLRDLQVQARILKRIDRAGKGNLGDIEPVGQGVSEMKILWTGLSSVFRPAWIDIGGPSLWRRQIVAEA